MLKGLGLKYLDCITAISGCNVLAEFILPSQQNVSTTELQDAKFGRCVCSWDKNVSQISVLELR